MPQASVPTRPLPAATQEPVTETSALQKWLIGASARVGASNAMLVAQAGKRIKHIAGAPLAERPDRAMTRVAARALKEKRVLVRDTDHPRGAGHAPQHSVCVGFSLRTAGRPGAVVFRLWARANEDDASLLRRVAALTLRRAEDQSDSAPPAAPTAVPRKPRPRSRPAPAINTEAAKTSTDTATTDTATLANSVSELVAEQGVLLASIAALVDQNDLERSLHALACSAAQQFRCSRVSVGCRVGRGIVIRAVSGLVDFDPRSALMVDVVQAMNETRMLASTIRVPEPAEEQTPPPNHASLAEQLNNPALMSVPLTQNGSVVGVLMLERDRAFDDIEARQLERLALLVAPMLALKMTDAMGAWQWLRRLSWRGLRRVFGLKYLGLKLAVLCIALLAVLGATHIQMFRLDADALIEARTQRAVVSGFPSFLRQVEARAGDVVTKGAVLAQLDVEELRLERIKLYGEREKLIKEYRANLAQRDRSKVRVLEAQRAQAQAKIDLIDAQIERATLRAPIDGVVLSADLFQSLGRPVERGELLFEVAALDDYRLILTLDEKDIGWVAPGATGQVRLRSLTQRTFPFEVTSITPVSEPANGANTFRIEATLQETPQSLRPGMEGIAKIEVEPRAVGWIWTRSFVDWVRLQVWKLGGL